MNRFGIKTIAVLVFAAHAAFAGLLMVWNSPFRAGSNPPAAMNVSVVASPTSAAATAPATTTHAAKSASVVSPAKPREQTTLTTPTPATDASHADTSVSNTAGRDVEQTAKGSVNTKGATAAGASAPRVDAGFRGNRVPDYPSISRRLGEQGSVLLKVMISPEGRAGEVQVLQSSGYARLDQSAAEAIRQWRFVPAMHDGKPVAAWYEWRWTFKLN